MKLVSYKTENNEHLGVFIDGSIYNLNSCNKLIPDNMGSFLKEGDELMLLAKQIDLKGTLHNHSNWSDGVNSLEEIVAYLRDDLKLEYLGICDHSKSAVYAKGLSIERVLQQQEEIEK